MIRIVIAEDQYTCQQIWQSYLEPEPDLEIIGTAVDGQQAIELVEKLKPDVVLMDINMPKMDGLTATEIISDRYSDSKVLILSISDNVEYIKQTIQIGAKGYFLKSIEPQELVTAIRNIHRGYYQLGRGLIEKLDSDISLVPKSDRTDLNDDLLARENDRCDMTQLGKTISKAKQTNFETDNQTSLNSVVVLPEREAKKLFPLKLKLLFVLLSGLFVLLLTPSGRSWWLKLPILSSLDSNKTISNLSSDLATILPVKTIKVNQVDSYQVDRTYTGTIVPRRSSSLGFERGGKLLDLRVDLGEQVEVNASLAILDTKKLEAKQKELFAKRKQMEALLKELQAGARKETVAAAQSTVTSIQSQLKLAQTKGQRRQELYASGAISREQLDEAMTEINTVRARLDEAQSKLDELLAGTRSEKIAAQQALLEQLNATLASLEVELEQSILKAPFRGRIAQRFVDEGTVVSPGEAIMTLIETSSLEVHVGVPFDTAKQVAIGSDRQLQIGNKIYPARVVSTFPQLDSVTHTLTVILSLDEYAAAEVRAGQVARLKLSETITEPGYWVPTTALVRGVRGLWSCFVLGSSENMANSSKTAFRIERQEVEVLQTQSERVFIRGTLQNNDRVIVHGNHRLVTNQLVHPISEE